MNTAPDPAVRAQMRRATTSVFEILLQQYEHEDRIDILHWAWEKSVLPKLTNDAERRKLEMETFHVPFPNTVGRKPARKRRRR